MNKDIKHGPDPWGFFTADLQINLRIINMLKSEIENIKFKYKNTHKF